MSEVAHKEGQRAASEYLRQLLMKPGRYRSTWHQHAVRPREDVINQMAVAEVIVSYLRSLPDRPGQAGMQPYQMRETVSGALSGRLSRETLEVFIGAFGFVEHEADRLQRLYSGSARISVISGSHAVTVHAERELAHVLGPRRHQTLSLHDHVYVGPDGRIDRARMLQVIEAIERGVDRVPFLCDTNVLTIEVGKGGKELAGQVQQVNDDLFFTEILLARTLDLGETISLEYWLTYRFPGNQMDPAEQEFRRGVMRHADSFAMRVEFHPDKLPAKVWWARWDGVEGEVLEQEQVTLDRQYSAHRYLRSLDRAVAGFRWSWD